MKIKFLIEQYKGKRDDNFWKRPKKLAILRKYRSATFNSFTGNKGIDP